MTTSPLDDLFGATAGGEFVDTAATNQRFEVTKAEAQPSKGGDPQIKLTLTARGGPSDGKLLIHRMTFKADGSPGGWSITNRSLTALGITPEFAAQVAGNAPAGSQVLTLFIEAAKVIVGRFVLADVAAQGGDGAYADRMQVQYALKPDTTPVTAGLGVQSQAPAPTSAAVEVAAAVPPPAPATTVAVVAGSTPADAPPF